MSNSIKQVYSVAFVDTTSARHMAECHLEDRVRAGSRRLSDQGLHPISEYEMEEIIDASDHDIAYRLLIRHVTYSRLLAET